jgi:membrane protein YdbS with pleckstrin-like domain
VSAGVALVIVILVFLVGIIVIGEIYAQMAYNRWFYSLSDNGLKLERGVIWKRYSNIPYERVQNVDIHRGILARMFGFSTVDIQTAGYHTYGGRGGQKSEGHIPAVGIEEAEKMRDFVTKRSSGKKTKGGV